MKVLTILVAIFVLSTTNVFAMDELVDAFMQNYSNI